MDERPGKRHAFWLPLIVILLIPVGVGFLARGLHATRSSHLLPMAVRTMDGLATALGQYKADYGVYPPDCDSVRDKCSETLVYYLGGPNVNRSQPQTTGPEDDMYHLKTTYFEFNEYYLRDKDNDGWQELMDPWQRPFIYNVGVNGGTAGPPESRCPGGKPRHNKDGFDLYSTGPDGLTGKSADYNIFAGPASLRTVKPVNSFYEAACNDESDGDPSAPVEAAPGSADDISNIGNWAAPRE